MFCMWFEAFGSVTYSVYMYMLKCFNMLELFEGLLKVLWGGVVQDCSRGALQSLHKCRLVDAKNCT